MMVVGNKKGACQARQCPLRQMPCLRRATSKLRRAATLSLHRPYTLFPFGPVPRDGYDERTSSVFPITVPVMSDIEKQSADETVPNPIVYERPTGLKGFYYNPYTQV